MMGRAMAGGRLNLSRLKMSSMSVVRPLSTALCEAVPSMALFVFRKWANRASLSPCHGLD